MAFLTIVISELKVPLDGDITATAVLQLISMPPDLKADDAVTPPIVIPISEEITLHFPPALQNVLFGKGALLEFLTLDSVAQSLIRFLENTPFKTIPPKPLPYKDDLPPEKAAKQDIIDEQQRKMDIQMWRGVGWLPNKPPSF